MFVILNPSPVILSPFASLRVNSAKNLTQGCHPERSEGSHEFLRLAQGRLREESQRINRLEDRDSSANASE
jgi:hypothetical protein